MRERSPALLRFAYLVTRNTEDARDAVQDALIGLLPRWEKVSQRGSVDAYVRRSVVNAAISAWRRERRSTPVDDPEVVAPAEADRTLEEEFVDAEVAWQICQDLPPDQRAAVVLRFYNDYTYAQIATVLGCREATARSHVHRALTKLRTRLVGVDHD
ncbi:MAG: RNA polymerase sigma factor [Propioniciclava sp.]